MIANIKWEIQILTNQQGNRITPSYVAWNPETCERMIGDAAKNQLTTNPHNTVSFTGYIFDSLD